MEGGLAQIDDPDLKGTVIAFAAAAGRTARNGSDGHLSFYTEALVGYLGVAGENLITSLQTVQNLVALSTNGNQNPYLLLSPGLPTNFMFRGTERTNASNPPDEVSQSRPPAVAFNLPPPTTETTRDAVKLVGDRVFFGSQDATISAQAKFTLETIASKLASNPNVSITVEGHASPDEGTREAALSVGEMRATAVKNALVSLGIAQSRIQTISYGKEFPAVVGDNPAAYAQNRRAVVVVN